MSTFADEDRTERKRRVEKRDGRTNSSSSSSSNDDGKSHIRADEDLYEGSNVKHITSFEDMGLKPDLLRGMYQNSTLNKTIEYNCCLARHSLLIPSDPHIVLNHV